MHAGGWARRAVAGRGGRRNKLFVAFFWPARLAYRVGLFAEGQTHRALGKCFLVFLKNSLSKATSKVVGSFFVFLD